MLDVGFGVFRVLDDLLRFNVSTRIRHSPSLPRSCVSYVSISKPVGDGTSSASRRLFIELGLFWGEQSLCCY